MQDFTDNKIQFKDYFFIRKVEDFILRSNLAEDL